MNSKANITIVGILRFSEDDGLLFSHAKPFQNLGMLEPQWDEALPNWSEWPGLGKCPESPKPQSSHMDEWRVAQNRWERDRDDYVRALHSDQAYKRAALEFVERQRREPILVKSSSQSGWKLFVYRDKVVRVDVRGAESEGLDKVFLIKHLVLRQERQYERVRREVAALENMEKLERVSREPIAESVRLFIWQRDRGQCVKCGSQKRLEFDHIIPVVEGGSSTERNVQLLCETCNRSKGPTI
jgi:HNH endonuclease